MAVRLHVVLTEVAATGVVALAYGGPSGVSAETAYNANKGNGTYSRVIWQRDILPIKVATPKRDGLPPVVAREEDEEEEEETPRSKKR